MTDTVKGWGQAVADNLNPFARLVNQVTADDGTTTVPYFQLEKVKEAAHQSDYGCDCVHKAVMTRTEFGSLYVRAKALHVVRYLMLEGPSGFNTKVSSVQGKFASMALSFKDARKDSLEEQVKLLAQSVHEACQGKTGALHRAIGDGDPQAKLAGQESGAGYSRAKSDFQEAQEREAKAYKKRMQEQRKGLEVIVLDKAHEQFDSSLSAPKLAASAVQSTKKKHSPEELNNFTHAALEHAKVSDVIAALDSFLRDPREPIQNRFKALMIVDFMVNTHPIAEAVTYFKAHTVGLTRTAQITEQTPKAQQMVQTATQLLNHLRTCPVPAPADTRSASAGSTGSAERIAPAAPPQAKAQQQQAAPQQPQQQRAPAAAPVIGSSNVNAAFGGGPSFDTMFGAMEVKKTGRPRGQSGANNNSASADGWSTASNAGSPAAQGGWGDSWGSPVAQQQQPQQQQQQQQQQLWGQSSTVSAASNTSTWGSPSAASPAAPQQPAAPAAAPAPAAPAATGGAMSPEEQLRQMQEMFQRNMMMMQQQQAMASQQQQPQQQQQQQQPANLSATQSARADDESPLAPPVAPEREPSQEQPPLRQASSSGGGPAAWGSTVMEPPPIATADELEEEDHDRAAAPNPATQRDESVNPTPRAGDVSPSMQMELSIASPSGYASASARHMDPSSLPVGASPMVSMSGPDTPAGNEPPAAPLPAPAAAMPQVTLQQLQELQAQMQRTQQMLQRQQQMFAQMQQLYMQQQLAALNNNNNGGSA